MTAEERAQLKSRILESMETVKQNVADLVELTKPIPPENAIGRISRMEAINSKSVNEEALRKARDKLSKLELALSKTDHPDFGICSRCKQPIAPARLMYLPESSRCVHCADK